MRSAVWACLFGVLLIVSHVSAHGDHDHDHDHESEEGEKSSSVLSLTPETFDDFIKSHDLTMVKFFAPWCGHCKALAPEYEKAAVDMAGQAELTEVDCTVHRDLCSRFGVEGFPTVKVFRKEGGKPVDYDQERKAEAIKRFLTKLKQPVYVTLDSKDAVDKAAEEKDFLVVAYIASDDSTSKDVFVSVASSLRNDFDFAVVNDASATKQLNVDKVPSIVIYKKTDAKTALYDGEFTNDGIEQFIKMYSMPLLGTIGPENYQKYLQRGYPLIWLFVNMDKDQQIVDAATEAAKVFLGKLSFTKLDGARWADHAKNLGVKKIPGAVISEQETRKNFVFPGEELTKEALVQWAQNYLDKKLAANVKSEPIPETNDEPVKVVVGKTYEQIVMDDTKDVLLEFYAPWCGHCKALAPKYEKLAEQFKNVESVVIAKIDATENDTPIDIKGFPTLYFFPAGQKQSPINYDGERTTEALAKFVREHATTLKSESAPAGKEDL